MNYNKYDYKSDECHRKAEIMKDLFCRASLDPSNSKIQKDPLPETPNQEHDSFEKQQRQILFLFLQESYDECLSHLFRLKQKYQPKQVAIIQSRVCNALMKLKQNYEQISHLQLIQQELFARMEVEGFQKKLKAKNINLLQFDYFNKLDSMIDKIRKLEKFGEVVDELIKNPNYPFKYILEVDPKRKQLEFIQGLMKKDTSAESQKKSLSFQSIEQTIIRPTNQIQQAHLQSYPHQIYLTQTQTHETHQIHSTQTHSTQTQTQTPNQNQNQNQNQKQNPIKSQLKIKASKLQQQIHQIKTMSKDLQLALSEQSRLYQLKVKQLMNKQMRWVLEYQTFSQQALNRSKSSNEVNLFNAIIFSGFTRNIKDENQIDFSKEKRYLIEHIEHFSKKTIRATRLLYAYDPITPANFHTYIDEISNYVVIIRPKNNCLIAAYSEAPLSKTVKQTSGPAFIASLWNCSSFQCPGNTQQRIPTTTYDPYNIIFGKSELVIPLAKTQIKSDLGIFSGCFVLPKKGTPKDLFGEQVNRIELQQYEIYQIRFD